MTGEAEDGFLYQHGWCKTPLPGSTQTTQPMGKAAKSHVVAVKMEEILRNTPSPSSFLGPVCPEKGSKTSNDSISLAQLDQRHSQRPARHKAVTGTSP